MKKINLTGTDLAIGFSHRKNIFSGVNLSLQNSEIIGIAGENGSGKSTLLRILAGLILPSVGKIQINIDDNPLKRENFYRHISLVSPYLTLYDEFTPLEHLKIYAQLRGNEYSEEAAIDLLKMFRLESRKDDPIREFSSGMKQRVKYIMAFMLDSEIIFLDEPFTNLDQAGINSIKTLIDKHIGENGAIVIASNDDREKELCSRIINLTI